ncbi:glycosyltransferase family 39 protein [Babjeviella inositovora NRRL Y-12698]|uniref:Dolichyl-phosphate-mannose--protein mannosyltransferase n=1 Tax=Babjeviella inositovora NRRL Y-12698 TaxID=984486 RepID=A0A1E3QLQ1_9ASCO|nr:glycosyltransferase family 39 protein [Babjeviella inositovora NRRL Y-12698]ODQ78626.1 glycosyltransferase family 39 protein [Babjeviella inositovora NRRL Y-12698]
MAKQAKRAAAKPSIMDDLDAVVVFDPKYEKGASRPFLVTAPAPDLAKLRTVSTLQELRYIAALVLLTTSVRLYNLTKPDSVVFDEVHFGGFARKYIQGKYFMDVHPPLAKMMFAAVGSLGGFKGDFEFKAIGDAFPVSTPYYLMRLFPAMLGVFTVVLFYLTLRASGCRKLVALITAAAFAVENSNVTISRYILLDSPLLFAIALAVYSIKKFEVEIPFSSRWFKSLVATGVGLGLAVSSKWVGLFTIAWVGVLCVFQLWFIIGDLSVSSKKVTQHIAARGIFLLGIPALMYILSFAIHFQALYREGEGSGFMSSSFRSSLSDNTIPSDFQADVGVRSTVSIRHFGTQNGYLHSHPHAYETGSKQQQITLYPHLDQNNLWYLELYNTTEAPTSFEALTDGTKVRMKHIGTGKRLHSHDEKAPVATQDWQKEATCYGFEGFEGDANDDFVFEIVKSKSKPGVAQERVRALETIFRLRHAMTGCYIFSSSNKLPDWGFKQNEVTCATQGKRYLEEFYIEANTNPYLPEDAEKISYKKASFWSKFFESHATMWRVNAGLTGSHNWQSSPETWPLLQRGINYWGKDSTHVYFLGNAIVWFASTLAIAVGVVHILSSIIRWQRGANVGADAHVFNYNTQGFLYILGWAIHYAPSFLMGRQMFLHHYLPALYFALLALGHLFDFAVTVWFARARKVGYALLVVFLVASIAFYNRYSALIYGTQWTKEKCEAAKYFDWDFDCGKYPEDYASYKEIAQAKSSESIAWDAATAVAVAPEAYVPPAEVESPPPVADSPVAEPEAVDAPVAAEAVDEGTVVHEFDAVKQEVEATVQSPADNEEIELPEAPEDKFVHETVQQEAVEEQVVEEVHEDNAHVEEPVEVPVVEVPVVGVPVEVPVVDEVEQVEPETPVEDAAAAVEQVVEQVEEAIVF